MSESSWSPGEDEGGLGLVSSHCKQKGIIASLWENNGRGHDWQAEANVLSQLPQPWIRRKARG